MSFSDNQKQAVTDVLGRYAEGYRKKDALEILALFSPDITGFGSGIDEVIGNRDQLAAAIGRDLSQVESVGITFRDMKIYGDMPVAWVTTFCDYRIVAEGGEQVMAGRMTAGLRTTGSRWLIEQLHFSLPCAGQEPGQSFPGAQE
jgi:ketosteroid isomerase-like protein